MDWKLIIYRYKKDMDFLKIENDKYILVIFPEENIKVRIYNFNFNMIQFDDGIELLKDEEFGLKIYKRLISEFGYISSNPHVTKVPIECKNIWSLLSGDNNFYIFSKDDVLLIFDKKYNYIKMKTKLRNFFREFYISRSVFDDAFCKDYPRVYKYVKNKMINDDFINF